MAYREFYYRWEWQLRSSPETLWPLLADTNRSNHDSGTPAIHAVPGDEALTNARRRLRLYRLGVRVDYEEEPFQWARPYRFGVVRRYSTGPMAKLRILADLNPRPDGGTHFVYQIWARPKNLFGFIAIPAQVGWLSARAYDRAVRHYDALGARQAPILATSGDVDFPPGGRQRLARLRQKMLAEGEPADLVARLAETIEQADDMTLARLRPYALADAWDASRAAVLELCLVATRAGLLDFQWDLLCPLCRGMKHRSGSLADLPSGVHCDACHIDFSLNFDRSVELTFRPNPSVRQVEANEYCVGGPHLTPHIVVQQLLPPAEDRVAQVPLEAGRYRLRTLALPGAQGLIAADDGEPAATLTAASGGWGDAEMRVSTVPQLRFENATDAEQLFILERTAWSDQAATAAEVTALQRFRDLFSNEALRPGEQISVGSLVFLFTDLRASTRMYRDIGDAPAFGRVMDHFDVLKQAIAAEGGAVVKTIGDAVMAVFNRPVAAMRATVRAQDTLAEQSAPLILKAGIHGGPCIAVTFNGRLDYFGSTVNIAARLPNLSAGRDILITSAIRQDPEVVALCESAGAHLTLEPVEAILKGLEAEHIELWRVLHGGEAPPDDNPRKD